MVIPLITPIPVISHVPAVNVIDVIFVAVLFVTDMADPTKRLPETNSPIYPVGITAVEPFTFTPVV